MLYDKKLASFTENGKTTTLMALALPLFIQSLTVHFIGTGNVLVVSNYSSVLVTVTSVTNQIINLGNSILSAVAAGMAIMVSVSFGAKNRDKAARESGAAVTTAFALGVLTALAIFILANPLISLMNLTGPTSVMAVRYLKGKAINLLITVITGVFSRTFICNGHSKPVVITSLLSSGISVAISYLFFYVVKSSIDDITFLIIKDICIALLHLVALVLLLKPYKIALKIKFGIRDGAKMLRLGIPVAMCSISFSMANTITTGFVAEMGEHVINAKAYINDIFNYVPLFCYSVSTAHSIITGRYRGARDFGSIKKLFKQDVLLAVLVNGGLSLLILIFHKPLMSMFTRDENIINLLKWVFIIDLPLEISRAVNNLSENTLNPCGDVAVTFLTSVIACWAFGVGVAYLFCVTLNGGLTGLWLAFLLNELFKTGAYLLRWRSGKWKNAKV